MMSGDEPERVDLGVWSAFVLGYGFALGFLLAEVSVAVVAGVIFAVAWSVSH